MEKGQKYDKAKISKCFYVWNWYEIFHKTRGTYIFFIISYIAYNTCNNLNLKLTGTPYRAPIPLTSQCWPRSGSPGRSARPLSRPSPPPVALGWDHFAPSYGLSSRSRPAMFGRHSREAYCQVQLIEKRRDKNHFFLNWEHINKLVAKNSYTYIYMSFVE